MKIDRRQITRDDIVEFIEEELGEEGEADIILFDGLEHAFLGVAERFEPITERIQHEAGGQTTRDIGGTHRWFAVYDYHRIIEGLMVDGMDETDAHEYFSFNIAGAYVGEATPAILYRMEVRE